MVTQNRSNFRSLSICSYSSAVTSLVKVIVHLVLIQRLVHAYPQIMIIIVSCLEQAGNVMTIITRQSRKSAWLSS